MGTDLQGREYARLDQLKAGDLVETEGIPCVTKNPTKVHKNSKDRLYVDCRYGSHFLQGQENEDGDLVGVYLLPKEQTP